MLRQRLLRRSTRGFSLIELLLAVVLAGILAKTAFTPYGDALESIQVRVERERAYMIARQMVERYKALGYDGMSGIGVNADGSQGAAYQELQDAVVNDNGVIVTYKRRMVYPEVGFTGTPLQWSGAAGYYHTDYFTTVVNGQPIDVSQTYRSIECRVGWANISDSEPRWISIDAVIRKQ